MKKGLILIVSGCVIAVVSVLIWLIAGRGKEVNRDYPQIAKQGVLNIVTDYNTIGYFVSGDTIVGFNHDLIELLQDYTNLKIEVLLESNLSRSIEGLKTGKYDILASSTPITSELRTSLSFTEPIAQNKQVLIQRKKEFNDSIEPIRSHLDLAKKTLYVPNNSPVILRIKNLSHEIGDTIYIQEDKTYGAEQLVMLVASKDIDYAVCDEKTAKRLAETNPEIDYDTLIGFTHFEAWAVRENSPVLLDSLNSWLSQIKKTERYKQIFDKYYE